jgi:O-antigen ligase
MFLFPLIPRGVRPVVIVLLLLITFYEGFISKQKPRWSFILLNSSLFLMYIISLSYTEDLSYGFKKVSSGLSLAVFPLIFGLMSQKTLSYIYLRRFKLLWAYVIAVVSLCIISFIKFRFDYTFDEVLIHYVNIIRLQLYGWNVNPIYLSMHICVGIIFSLFIYNRGTTKVQTVLLIAINFCFLLFLALLIKKGPIIALILVMGYMVIQFKRKALIYLYSGLLLLTFMSIVFVPKINQRFSELLNIQDTDNTLTNSSNIRYSIYKCNLAIIPEAGFLGYGIGDGKNELINCFIDKSPILAENRYNSHNQYAGLILKVGFIGLFLFVIFILVNLLRSKERRNYLAVSVILFYSIVMFSENILERENGVLYACLFINFFVLMDRKYVGLPSSENEHTLS